MRKAIENETGIDIGADDARTVADLQARIKEKGLEDVVPLAPAWGAQVDELFSECVEPKLIQPMFITDHPLETSPFAKKTPHDPRFVERFEGFIAGMELSNAFSELNDPDDQRERFMQQTAGPRRRRRDRAPAGRGLPRGHGARHAAHRRPRHGHRPPGDAAHRRAQHPRRHPLPGAAQPGLTSAGTRMPSAPEFPGFDHLYMLSDPCHWGAVFGAGFDEEHWDSLRDIARGELHPERPLPIRWQEGRQKPGQVIWPSILGLVVRDDVIAVLEKQGFTGWSTYPVELRGKDGSPIDGYNGIAVTGRCGPIDDEQCIPYWREYPAGLFAEWRGLFFDPMSWDGSDFFTPEGSLHPWILMAKKVEVALRKARISNLHVERLDLWMKPGLDARPFPPVIDGIPVEGRRPAGSPPISTESWPERDERFGAAVLRVPRGWRENQLERSLGPEWSSFSVQRPPHARWDVLYVRQAEVAEPPDIASALARQGEWQALVDRWSAAGFGRHEQWTRIEASALGGEFAWRWTASGTHEKQPRAGVNYLVLTAEYLFFLSGYGPCESVEDLDPGLMSMLESFRFDPSPRA